jgi:hypothetical protein
MSHGFNDIVMRAKSDMTSGRTIAFRTVSLEFSALLTLHRSIPIRKPVRGVAKTGLGPGNDMHKQGQKRENIQKKVRSHKEKNVRSQRIPPNS